MAGPPLGLVEGHAGKRLIWTRELGAVDPQGGVEWQSDS